MFIYVKIWMKIVISWKSRFPGNLRFRDGFPKNLDSGDNYVENLSPSWRNYDSCLVGFFIQPFLFFINYNFIYVYMYLKLYFVWRCTYKDVYMKVCMWNCVCGVVFVEVYKRGSVCIKVYIIMWKFICIGVWMGVV